MSLIHNERVKLTAGALDRASTACFAGTVIAPGAGWQALTANLPSGMVPAVLAMIFALWMAAGLGLHYLAWRALGGLKP